MSSSTLQLSSWCSCRSQERKCMLELRILPGQSSGMKSSLCSSTIIPDKSFYRFHEKGFVVPTVECSVYVVKCDPS